MKYGDGTFPNSVGPIREFWGPQSYSDSTRFTAHCQCSANVQEWLGSHEWWSRVFRIMLRSAATPGKSFSAMTLTALPISDCCDSKRSFMACRCWVTV